VSARRDKWDRLYATSFQDDQSVVYGNGAIYVVVVVVLVASKRTYIILPKMSLSKWSVAAAVASSCFSCLRNSVHADAAAGAQKPMEQFGAYKRTACFRTFGIA